MSLAPHAVGGDVSDLMLSGVDKDDAAEFALQHVFGLRSFRHSQRDVIDSTLRGENVFVIMPTGGGKSLCYQIPAVVQPGLVLVVSPLLSLIQDQVMALVGLPCGGVPAAYLTSTLSDEQARAVLRDLHSPDPITKLLYVTPEKLDSSVNFRALLAKLTYARKLSLVVFDEAHCVSQWGHDFRTSYAQAGRIIREACEGVPVMALTATATTEVRDDVIGLLRMERPRIFRASFNRPNLHFAVRPKPSKQAEAYASVYEVVAEHKGRTGIVYCLSRKETEQVAEYLHAQGVSADYYHAGMSARQREEVQVLWQQGHIHVVCATIAYGMGIDHASVRFVVHFTMPKSVEGYYQEAGRAGRDGQPARCIVLFKEADVMESGGGRGRRRRRAAPTRAQQVAMDLAQKMAHYCKAPDCRRMQLLQYFGERITPTQCQRACDVCDGSLQRERERERRREEDTGGGTVRPGTVRGRGSDGGGSAKRARGVSVARGHRGHTGGVSQDPGMIGPAVLRGVTPVGRAGRGVAASARVASRKRPAFSESGGSGTGLAVTHPTWTRTSPPAALGRGTAIGEGSARWATPLGSDVAASSSIGGRGLPWKAAHRTKPF